MSNFNIAMHMQAVKQKNIEAIEEYMRNNPYSSARDCSRDLGMKYDTVSRHIRNLKKARKDEK